MSCTNAKGIRFDFFCLGKMLVVIGMLILLGCNTARRDVARVEPTIGSRLVLSEPEPSAVALACAPDSGIVITKSKNVGQCSQSTALSFRSPAGVVANTPVVIHFLTPTSGSSFVPANGGVVIRDAPEEETASSLPRVQSPESRVQSRSSELSVSRLSTLNSQLSPASSLHGFLSGENFTGLRLHPKPLPMSSVPAAVPRTTPMPATPRGPDRTHPLELPPHPEDAGAKTSLTDPTETDAQDGSIGGLPLYSAPGAH